VIWWGQRGGTKERSFVFGGAGRGKKEEFLIRRAIDG
jgi:hypothetical protein